MCKHDKCQHALKYTNCKWNHSKCELCKKYNCKNDICKCAKFKDTKNQLSSSTPPSSSQLALEGLRGLATPGHLALEGLRGLATLHIVLHHSLGVLHLPWGGRIQMQGGIAMPLFFLLSGYSLALAYGKKMTQEQSNEEPTETSYFWHPSSLVSKVLYMLRWPPETFSSWSFYRARLARILPLYYLSNLLCLPLLHFGLVSTGNPLIPEGPLRFWLHLGSSFSLTNTWLLMVPGAPYCIPSWTVSTLAFFYLLFPFLLAWAKTLSQSSRVWHLTLAFYLQLLVPIPAIIYFDFLVPPAQLNGGEMSLAYWPTTTSPISRLPVFVMGLLAGLQDKEDPLPRPLLLLLPSFCSRPPKEQEKEEQEYWSRRTDWGALLLLLLLSTAVVSGLWRPNQVFNFYFQLVGVYLMLNIILGLNKDSGQSYLSCLLRLPPFPLLGSLSLPLYLLHEPCRLYFTLVLHWLQDWPQGRFAGVRGETFDTWLLPVWTLPVLLPIVFLLSLAAHRLVEVPARIWLKPPQTGSPPQSKESNK